MDMQIIRSRRRTAALEMRPEGLLVRVPEAMEEADIQRLLHTHRRWIASAAQRMARLPRPQPLSPEELRALAGRAAAVFPARAARYAPQLGVTYGRIAVRSQRTRWGSCSAKGNLNFNCLLLLAPPEVLDSVVVHELCHRREMSHSPKFYAEVLRVFPDYWACSRWLKENGQALLARLPR